jgi:glycine cleavage system H protein
VNIPAELHYTKEHEWVKIDGNVATIGITDYAQGELGDIVFVELPRVGDKLTFMKPFGTIEAVKAVSELFAPVNGTVKEINKGLDSEPMAINRDPYGDGWMVKVELADASWKEQLLSSGGYTELLATK